MIINYLHLPENYDDHKDKFRSIMKPTYNLFFKSFI